MSIAWTFFRYMASAQHVTVAAQRGRAKETRERGANKPSNQVQSRFAVGAGGMLSPSPQETFRPSFATAKPKCTPSHGTFHNTSEFVNFLVSYQNTKPNQPWPSFLFIFPTFSTPTNLTLETQLLFLLCAIIFYSCIGSIFPWINHWFQHFDTICKPPCPSLLV